MKKYKIVVFVPVNHTEFVLEAMAEAGAGVIGNYTNCSFSSRGTGRFLPNNDAKPFIGKSGKLEEVEEDRVEMLCSEDKLDAVLTAMKKIHPYEEVAYDVYSLENI